MCRRAVIKLPPRPEAASIARRFLTDTCALWELADLRDDALLAVSELVTNSVVHARTPIVVNAAVAAGFLEVGVSDHEPKPPELRPLRSNLIRDLDALAPDQAFDDDDPRHPSLWVGSSGSVTAGRGLHLLEAMTDHWGVTEHEPPLAGKEVWFTRAVRPSWPYASQCECGPGAPVTTASGLGLRPIPGPWDNQVR
jgi:hypothetical protein